MGHQVLARKWRPQDFSGIIGQEQIVVLLQNALQHNRLHNAYLFTGTRGVGKTTLARIFARCLNCTQDTAPSASPCGSCPSCESISKGNFPDLIEIDAASRTGVDDTRQLLEDAQYPPAMGRYKVFLIDEVHMLSTSSFNAMLKTLEEPPPHALFLLATTDPQKVPATVLSRCLQLSLRAVPTDLITAHLADILGREEVTFADEAVEELAISARGSIRDGLTLADQAINYTNADLQADKVRAMLGALDRTTIGELALALARGDTDQTMELCNRIGATGNYHQALDALLSLFHQAALAQLAKVLDSGGEFRAIAAQLAREIPPEQLQLIYQIALLGRRDLELAADARQGFEMLALRMLAFTPNAADALQSPLPGADDSGQSGAVPPTSDDTPPADQSTPSAPPAAASVSQPDTAEAPAVAASKDGDAESAAEQLNAAMQVNDADSWIACFNQLPLNDRHHAVLSELGFVKAEAGVVHLGAPAETYRQIQESIIKELNAALQSTGHTFSVHCIESTEAGQSPLTAAQQQQRGELSDYRQNLLKTPLVQEMQKHFGVQEKDINIKWTGDTGAAE